MKVVVKPLLKSLKDLPRAQRKHIGDTLRKSVFEGVRLAKVLAPDGNGDLKSGIHAKFERSKTSFRGSIEAAPSDRESQIKALSVEFGRTGSGGSRQIRDANNPSDKGKTDPNPFIRRTQDILGKKMKGRINRAINKAVKEVGFK